MNRTEQLERDLRSWFAETAVPSNQDYTEEILIETAGIRQRPRWTFVSPLSRPMNDAMLGLRRGTPPRQMLIGLALVGLLLLGLVAAYIGSRPRLLAPFGPAANGLVAYEKGGDIFTVDPATGERRPVSVGPEVDHAPRWSLDGRLLAFLRGESPSVLVVTDALGKVEMITDGGLINVDSDTVAWSPDGLTIAVAAEGNFARAIHLVDVISGNISRLPVNYRDLEVLWRPPDGRELMFVGGTAQRVALYRYSLDDRRSTEVAGTATVRQEGDIDALRPVGWTPDGARFAYQRRAPGPRGSETHVLDLRTGDVVVLPVGSGRISNDGGSIVGIDGDGQMNWLCLVSTNGGACTRIGGPMDLVEGSGFASFQWAPDDKWIRADLRTGSTVLLDPGGSPGQQPPWLADGAASWQRVPP
jgi:Tol biopolymer transport system component